MNEAYKYLGIEYPDGNIGLEGPYTETAAQKRINYFVEERRLLVTAAYALTKGEAILKILGGIISYQRNTRRR